MEKAVTLVKLNERHCKYGALEEGEQVAFGASLATGVFWLVFLLFLPAVLYSLGISEIADPLQGIFDNILGVVPNILTAGVVLGIGWFVARVIFQFQIQTNLLKAVGADNIGKRVGLSEEYSLSTLVGRIVYIFIMMVTIITALDPLKIAALSQPATKMLTTIVDAIPGVLGAVFVIIISYAVAKLVSYLVEEL